MDQNLIRFSIGNNRKSIEMRQRRAKIAGSWVGQTFVVIVEQATDATLHGIVLVHVLAITMVTTEAVHLGEGQCHDGENQQNGGEDAHYCFGMDKRERKK